MKQVLRVAAMLVLVGPATSAAAGNPPGVVLIEARTAAVGTPDAVEQKVSQKISFGHEGFKVRRVANSPAEIHADHSHSLMVQSGRGTVVLGGRVVDVDGRAASPNTAGTSLRDGTEYALSAGAVMFVPANTNHQWLVTAGDELTYVVVNLPPAGSAAPVAYYPASTVPDGPRDPVEQKVTKAAGYGQRSGYVVQRGAASKAEAHDDHGHAMVVMRGEGTVILGGTIVDGNGDPAEANVVGTSISQGVEYTLKPGDALYFPAKTHHQYVGTPDAPFIYFTLNE